VCPSVVQEQSPWLGGSSPQWPKAFLCISSNFLGDGNRSGGGLRHIGFRGDRAPCRTVTIRIYIKASACKQTNQQTMAYIV